MIFVLKSYKVWDEKQFNFFKSWKIKLKKVVLVVTILSTISAIAQRKRKSRNHGGDINGHLLF
jgi:hypothetical protein